MFPLAIAQSDITIPAPVFTPIIGYGTIFTVLVAVLGAAGTFYAMKTKVDLLMTAMDDLKTITNLLHDAVKDIAINRAAIKSNEQRLSKVEDELTLRKIAVSFGKTAATKSGVFIDQNADEVEPEK